MNEYVIQDLIYKWLVGHHINIIPNLYLYQWESDMISVTKSGYVHEYEIKISKKDFYADFLKKEKHQVLKDGYYEPSEYEKKHIEIARHNELNGLSNQYIKKLTSDNKIKLNRPNYFWYVIPDGLIDLSKIPDYAGIIILSNEYEGIIHSFTKKGPLLHRQKIEKLQLQKIINSFQFKYWRLRVYGK